MDDGVWEDIKKVGGAIGSMLSALLKLFGAAIGFGGSVISDLAFHELVEQAFKTLSNGMQCRSTKIAR